MASQPIAAADVIEIRSYVRGYHAYQDKWLPVQGDVLLLARELTNATDKLAVAVIKSGDVVGHVPYNLAPTLSQFLRRDFNKAVATVRVVIIVMRHLSLFISF